MQSVSISAVQPGEVLARPVTTKDGVVLCPAGFPLTYAVIERLRTLGVESVIVEGGDPEGPTTEQRLAELSQRYEGIEDPVMLQIKAAAENQLSRIRLSELAASDTADKT